MSPSPTLVLVGMSRSEVVRREELLGLAAELSASGPVEVAFLQQAEPSLSSVLTRLADAGAERLVLVAVVADSGLKALAPGPRGCGGSPLTGGGGAAPTASRGDDGDGLCSVSAEDSASAVAQPWEITGEEPGLTSPAWELPPAAGKRLFVCRGPRCTAVGPRRRCAR